MAEMTRKYRICVPCQKSEKTESPRLFDVLNKFSQSTQKCPSCGHPTELRLIFPLGLGAGTPECKVLDVFTECVDWQQADGKTVTFRPFLVVMEQVDNQDLIFWLPYWHFIDGDGAPERKYGQWAPWMNAKVFGSLLEQARTKGYIAMA